MKPAKKTEIVNHHKVAKCEGCNLPRRHIGWFLGHWLCRKCMRRKNMPLVGYKNKQAWNFEKKIISRASKRNYPTITYSESKYLWAKYSKIGLTPYEIKCKMLSLKSTIRHSHWAYKK